MPITHSTPADGTFSASGEAAWEAAHTISPGTITTTELGGDITTAGKALLDDADAAAQRATLGLGTAAVTASSAYDIAGSAEAAQLASQPLDTDLTAIAALTTATYGRSLLTLADAAALRTTALLSSADSPQFTAVNVGHATDTTVTRTGAGDIAVEGNAIYRAGGTDVPLADGGTGASLTDPNADRIMFWDDSAGAVTWLTAGTNLTITGTTIDAAGGSGFIKGLIVGMAPTWVSTTQLGSGAGAVYIESLDAMITGSPATITPSSPTANTWYHVYVYSVSGTPTLEASTTAPVAFATPMGTARSKSADTSRRYLYSARTNASSLFRCFSFDPSTNDIIWMNSEINASPYRVLSNGAATTSTAIDCSAVVPVTSRAVIAYYQNYHATNAFYISSFDYTTTATAFNLGIAGNSHVYSSVPCSSDQKLNYMNSGAGAGSYIDVYGFPLQR